MTTSFAELVPAHRQRAYFGLRQGAALGRNQHQLAHPLEVEGVEREMTFLTNNFSWAASTVAELYRARWQIEVFFKQIKQTLQLTDFLGNSDNAVRWQVWTALLVYVLMRYQAWTSQWSGSFLRLWACLRAALWLKLDVISLLKSYGIAGQHCRMMAQPQQAYLPGFRPAPVG